MSSSILQIFAIVIGLGVAAQVLADRFQVPSVPFLIIAGIAIGPEGLGLLTRETFGGALTPIVGLSVSIIIFEGAFNLNTTKLRQAPSETLGLITIGAIIAFVGTAVVVHVAVGALWGVSLLVGALLVATGPTVIRPILSVVHVRERVAATLETEGVVNDVTAAILAVAIFEAVTLQETDFTAFLRAFFSRLGIGVLIGCVVGLCVWYVLKHIDLSPRNAPQYSRLLVLASAVVAHASAETFSGEAGIVAAATVGLLLGNTDLPYEANIAEFKDDLTLLVLSFIFIMLASLIDFDSLEALGVGGLIVILAVVFVIRPLLVLVSTRGDRFTLHEKLFMSFVAPRGIIPASVATLFALRIQEVRPISATRLAGTVFLVILVTVVFEGGFARHIAEYLDVIPQRVIIIGGGSVGRTLAERYLEDGQRVEIVESDRRQLEAARDAGFIVHAGDGTDPDVLPAAGVRNAKLLVAATDDDEANLRIAELATETFNITSVIARVNMRENTEQFERLGVETLPTSLTEAWAVGDLTDETSWIVQLLRSRAIRELVVKTPDLIGVTPEEFEATLPQNTILAAVVRDGENKSWNSSFTFERNDSLILLGWEDEIQRVIDQYPTQ